MLYSIQYTNGWLAASNLFHMFRQKIIPLSVQMLEKCSPSSRQCKWMVATFSKFYSKIWVSFGLNNGEWFLLEVAVSDQLKEHRFFHKAALWIFKIAVRLRDQQVFMWRSVKTLNIFSTSNLKQIFQKTITFFKKLQYCFLVWGTRSKTHHFRTKLPYLQPMLRQIQWWPQNGPITKTEFFQ